MTWKYLAIGIALISCIDNYTNGPHKHSKWTQTSAANYFRKEETENKKYFINPKGNFSVTDNSTVSIYPGALQ